MNGGCAGSCLIALLVAGCGSPPLGVASPAGPTGVPPSLQIQNGPFSVSGVITDGSSRVSGASVSAFVEQPGLGYSYTGAHGPQTSDAAGEFHLSGLPAGVTVYIQASKDGSVPQCAIPKLTISGDVTLTVQLVSLARLSSSSSSLPPSPPGFRHVIGTVTRVVGGVKQPVADAFVDYEPIEDFPAAVTRSDAEGRFALCGIPEMRRSQSERAALDPDSVMRRRRRVRTSPSRSHRDRPR